MWLAATRSSISLASAGPAEAVAVCAASRLGPARSAAPTLTPPARNRRLQRSCIGSPFRHSPLAFAPPGLERPQSSTLVPARQEALAGIIHEHDREPGWPE